MTAVTEAAEGDFSPSRSARRALHCLIPCILSLVVSGCVFRPPAPLPGNLPLPPEDTLPIATYKIFGSEVAPIPPLVYVYLVDWTLKTWTS